MNLRGRNANYNSTGITFNWITKKVTKRPLNIKECKISLGICYKIPVGIDQLYLFHNIAAMMCLIPFAFVSYLKFIYLLQQVKETAKCLEQHQIKNINKYEALAR